MRASTGRLLQLVLASVATHGVGADSPARLDLPPALAAQVVAVAESQPAPADDRLVEPFFSTRYVKVAWSDVVHVVSAPGRWSRRDWATAGIATLGVAATMAVVDEPFRDAVNGGRDDDPDGLLGALEPFGTRRYTTPVLVAFYATGAARGDDRARAVALDGFVSTVIAGNITSALKYGFGRARPYVERGATEFDPFSDETEYNTFPSGHATHAFSLAAVIAAHYEAPWVDGLAYGVASLVAAQRLRDDQHWLTDVGAGAAIGIAVGRSVVHHNRELREGRRFTLSGDGRSLQLRWEW